ncbi:putative The fantastic four family protein [Helianthus debilis subsp. tardiflorus]
MYLCSSAINTPSDSQQFVDPNFNLMTQMQGIGSILRSDNPEKTNKAASLRRTLSADMSSKWLADNGLPVMKKIASSENIAIDSDEEECEVNEKGDQNPTRVDIWTAIMSQKKQDDSGKLPPPYVHPLVKKSRSLSETSLKICTESLGSETGSDVFSAPPAFEKAGSENGPDVFSSPPASEKATGDEQEEKEETNKVVKPAGLTTKKAQHARSFPPPLASLAAARTDGSSLHMHSRRVDGRLVVEAVSVQQQKYFEAQRQDGRFLLTLVNDPNEHEQPSEPYNNNNNNKVVAQASHMRGGQDVSGQLDSNGRILTLHFRKNMFPQQETLISKSNGNNLEEYEDEIVTDFSDNDVGILKIRPLNPTTAVIDVHKSTVSIKRILERDNENPSWSRKLELVEEDESPITQSPPPRARATGRPPLPPPTTTTTVNSYQYFWRAKPTVASVIDPMITQHRPPTKTKDLVLLRGNKADCFLPSLKGCKEPRRSLLMWEPFCIATS